MEKSGLINLQKLKLGKIWFFRFKKLNDFFIITNDAWKFVYLSPDEFRNFIWGKITKGDKFEELVERWFIKNNEYFEKSKMRYAKKYWFLAFWPSLHIIILTWRCNHACKYCHASVSSEKSKWLDLTKEDAKKIIDTIYFTTAPEITIEFQWWEPLLNWDVLKFCTEYAEEKAKKLDKKTNFTIVSNLSLMTEDKVVYLANHNFCINSSLDWNEETHNFNRTYSWWNSFELAIKWIKYINWKIQKDWALRDKMWPSMWAALTVTRKTIENWKECIDTYTSLNMKEIWWRPLNQFGFWEKSFSTLWYSAEEFIESYEKVFYYILDLNKKWVKIREVYASIFLKKILDSFDPNYVDTRSPCWAWVWQIAYNYDGKIYTCDEWRMLWRTWDDSFLMWTLENSWRETYNKIITSDTTKTILSASNVEWYPWYEYDVYKPYLWICPAMNYNSSGNIYPNYATDFKRKFESKILDLIFTNLRDKEIKEIFISWINPWK